MPSKVIHVWKPLEAQTLCGLWFKGISATQKPNMVSEKIANWIIFIGANGIDVCGNCVSVMYSNKNRKGEN